MVKVIVNFYNLQEVAGPVVLEAVLQSGGTWTGSQRTGTSLIRGWSMLNWRRWWILTRNPNLTLTIETSDCWDFPQRTSPSQPRCWPCVDPPAVPPPRGESSRLGPIHPKNLENIPHTPKLDQVTWFCQTRNENQQLEKKISKTF